MSSECDKSIAFTCLSTYPRPAQCVVRVNTVTVSMVSGSVVVVVLVTAVTSSLLMASYCDFDILTSCAMAIGITGKYKIK